LPELFGVIYITLSCICMTAFNKLLGVTITDSLRWGDYTATITAKASKCLWFMKKLKRAGVSQSDLVYSYEAVIIDLSCNVLAQSGSPVSYLNSSVAGLSSHCWRPHIRTVKTVV